jgi:nucleoside-diphosphate-sugar epimerase
MKTLVTGATGLIGRVLLARLLQDGHQALAAVRSNPISNQTLVGEINAQTDWSQALSNCDVVVHTAARVHQMQDDAADSLAEFRRINTAGTLNLAYQSAAAGVKRLVFISTIKVNGEFTEVGQAFSADDVPAPEDPYGISKHEAEQLLHQVAAETGMEVVIIRSPLVYGPGVKANFQSMMRWLVRGVPLPLAAVTENRRSLVALDNLVDLIMTCLNHPAAANQTFLVSDGEDLSTADLLQRMGMALGHPARLIYVPLALLKLGAIVVNKPGIYQRLCGSLQLNITKTRQLLGWVPPVSVDEGLRRAALGFPQ